MVTLLIMLVPSAALGFLIGRWWAVIVVLVAFGDFYGGVGAGLWGNGFGEGWQVAMALVMGSASLAAWAGFAVRRLWTAPHASKL